MAWQVEWLILWKIIVKMLTHILGGVGTFAKEKKLEARRRSQRAWVAFWTMADCMPFGGGLSVVLGH